MMEVKRHSLFLISLLLLSLFPALAASGRDIVFAPLPMEQQEKVLRQIVPMLRYLEKPLANRFTVSYYNDYADILRDFQEQKIDLAFLGPLPYIQLRSRYPEAEPVVRFLNAQGKDTYTCSLITGVESGFTTVQELKGKRIALTQPHSTCGYLSTASLIQQAGFSIKDTRYQYTGSHQEVALSVVRGEYDGGGIKTSIGKKYSHLGLRFLAATEPLPGFLLVANKKRLSEAVIATIRSALLSLHPLNSAADRELTRGWGYNVRFGATMATDSDYDGIRNKLQQMTIPDKGNY